jgi:hypothetical protein
MLEESNVQPTYINASRREAAAVCFTVAAKPSANHSEVVAINDVRTTATIFARCDETSLLITDCSLTFHAVGELRGAHRSEA